MPQGDINVTNTDSFDHFGSSMDGIASAFNTTMGEVASNSASSGTAGTMEEGQAFLQNERAARELLVQYMSKTSEGLTGYRTAVSAIGQEHLGLIQLTNSRMQALLKPHDGPTAVNPIFEKGN
ncbi:MAG TPA: hypothetical protein VFG33_29900 [Kribbella sp.]|uniref:hypothetical protein n=1 Tax=Kribbella sp. TaxID=1871183 RepID=UPI002D794524|nr:hypothetical protein [Kribbella sp.]HET6297636.1 hypothetical protein [Kribbella sp.]